MTPTTEDNNLSDAVEESASAHVSDAQPTTSSQCEKRRVVINAGSNAAVMVVKVIVGFAVAPLIVHGLGDTQYGIWIFVSSITAYLALGDLGIKSAVIRFVARYDGLRDRDGINRVLNTSIAILSCVAAIVLAVTFVVAHFWRLPKSIPGDLIQETRLFFVLSGIQVAMLLPMSVLHAMLAGLGRFPMRNCVSVISLVLRNAAIVAVIWCGGGLVAVGLVLLASCGLDYVMLFWTARRCLPSLAFAPRYVDREMLKIIGGYGLNMFAGDIAFMVIGQSAPLIIGACLASADCNTYYSMGAQLKDYSLSILGMIMLVLVPAVGKWQATGDHAAIRALLIHATRYALYFIIPIELGLLTLGRSFLSIWMGPRYADAGYATLVMLSIPLVLSAVGMVASRVLQGVGKVRPLAIITAIQAVLTVVFSIALARPFGIEGVACGVSLAMAPAAVAATALACRCVHVGFMTLLVRAFCGPLAASSVATLAWIALEWWLPIDNWAKFFAIGSLGTMPFAVIVLFLERDVRRAATGIVRRCVGLLSAASRVPAGWLGIDKN